jgi:uncharacterized membrane protein
MLFSRLRRRHDENGAVAVLAVSGLVVAMIAASLAIDLGTLSQTARQDQKIADLAALDGVRALPADPTAAVIASATRNALTCPDTNPADGCGMTVQWSDSITGIFTSSALTLPLASAVRVSVTQKHSNDFPLVGGGKTVTRTATATQGNGSGCYTPPDICVRTDSTPIGTVKVGSTLASVTSEGTILDKLLTQTVGGTYTLNAVGWQGLSSGSVSFSRLRTALGMSTGTTDSVLDANLTYRQLLDATVSALNAQGGSSVTVATYLATIATQVSTVAGATMTLRKFFDITGNVGSGKDVADATMNVKDIVVGGMTLADSDHFASLHLTAADIPGLPGNYVDVKFGLIEAPQVKSGPPKASGVYRTIAHTGQIRLQVTVNLSVSVLGLGILDVNVPYYLEIGAADAKLDTLTCPSGSSTPTDVSILGTTDAGKTVVGVVADVDLRNPAATPVPTLSHIVNVLGITLDANSIGAVTITLAGNSGTLLHFSPPYTATSASQHINATTFNLPSLTSSNTTTVGGGLLNGLVTTTVLNAISVLLPGLTTSLLNPMMKGLGVSYAGADIWAPPPQNCSPTSFNVDPPPAAVVSVPSLVG